MFRLDISLAVPVQAICAEGKVRGGASVVNQAPAAKRSLERFVFEMHSLFLRAGEPPEAITVGFLKHRDIQGNAMPSQVGVTWACCC